MCGICGKYNFKLDKHVNESLIMKMNSRLYRRGPDEGGMWINDNMGFGVRMLHIRDAEYGRQPFFSEDKNIVSVLNGEIYNYKELKDYLLKKGHSLCTDCDAEIIPHLYEEYGPAFIKLLNGMFAIALFERSSKTLILARDRMGIKPLYYALTKEAVVFSSQLQSLMQDKSISDELDHRAINCYFSYNYFPAEYTPFREIKKIMPGHYFTLQGKSHRVEKYWEFNFRKQKVNSDAEYIDELKMLMEKTVSEQLTSDTDAGVFLSGGVDSGILAYYANKLQSGCKTFSVGFQEETFDERSYARNIVQYLKMNNHHEIELPDNISCLIEQMSDSMDLPVGEGSYVPLFALSDFAKNHAGVILSGEGADELFGGYQAYIADIWAKYYKMIPSMIGKNILKTAIGLMPRKYEWMNRRQKMELFYNGIAEKNKIAHYFWREIFTVEEKRKLYKRDFLEELDTDTSVAEPYALFSSNYNLADLNNFLEKAMFFDTRVCLPDGMLHRVDMASMYSSLEARVPYLDNRIVDFAMRLPLNQKIRGLRGKHLFKKAFQSVLPHKILYRKKHGLSVPVSKWLKDDIKEFAQGKLLEESFVPFINRSYLENMFAQHCSGGIDAGRKLWNMLIFNIWMRKMKNT